MGWWWVPPTRDGGFDLAGHPWLGIHGCVHPRLSIPWSNLAPFKSQDLARVSPSFQAARVTIHERGGSA